MHIPHLNIPCLNQRHWIALVSLWALTISYMMRSCISLAITVISPHGGQDKEDPNACPYNKNENSSNHGSQHEYLYNWDEHTQGIILSSFFWGYIVTQIPGGIIADRLGSKMVLLVTLFCTSVFTILTPVSIYKGDWSLFIVVRVILGLAQGAFYSSLHHVVSSWIPSQERGLWGSIIFIGSQLGNGLSFFLSGYIISAVGEKNWSTIFYLYGGVGLICTSVIFFTVYATPQEHPKLKPNEKEILDEHIAASSKIKGIKKTPLVDVLKSMPIWAIAAGMIGHDWGFFALTVDLPKYFQSVMHFNVKENGIYTSIGYFFITAIAISSGFLVDYIEKRKFMSLTWNRILFTSIASVLPSLGIVTSAYTNCDRLLAVMSLVIGVSFMGTYYPSLKMNPIDLSPNHSSFVGAIGGCCGSITGIVVPYLIGVLTPNGFLVEWRRVFWITFGVMSTTNLFYAIFASAEIQPWNNQGLSSDGEQQAKK